MILSLTGFLGKPMSSYTIETPTGAGHITDPVDGGVHYEIDPYEDERGGTIEVDRADSAKYIVDSGDRLRFVSKAPTAKAVKEAEKERFDFAGSDICVAFAKRFGNNSLGSQTLDVSEGFDPVTDTAHNDRKMKVTNAYNRLDESGYTDEAGYLRALATLAEQNDFVSFAREQLGVDL